MTLTICNRCGDKLDGDIEYYGDYEPLINKLAMIGGLKGDVHLCKSCLFNAVDWLKGYLKRGSGSRL